ncbi:MAG TPA: GPW/gp25 family protein [Streptosporangiaceae bacterium]|nr:GPW/gp25 family protein [Streptosporangiaceae bacterium]
MADFIGKGWAFPLGFEPSGSVAMARGEEKIEQAMRLILSTYPGERPMRPRWGSTLRDNVFGGTGPENAAAIAHEVERALDYWEPRASVSQVLVYPDSQRQELLYIDIWYTVRGMNSPRNLVFPFYTIPERSEGEI